jgi:hypothetical protein
MVDVRSDFRPVRAWVKMAMISNVAVIAVFFMTFVVRYN